MTGFSARPRLNVVERPASTLKDKGWLYSSRLGPGFLIRTDYELLRSVALCISTGTVLCIDPAHRLQVHPWLRLTFLFSSLTIKSTTRSVTSQFSGCSKWFTEIREGIRISSSTLFEGYSQPNPVLSPSWTWLCFAIKVHCVLQYLHL